MQLTAVQRVLALLLMIFSTTMLPPAVVSWWYGDGVARIFLLSFVVELILGAMVWLPVRSNKRELRLRDGFLIVALFWIVLSLFAAVPLMLSEQPHLRMVDAVFEATSGLTTTGSSVLSGIEHLPKSILWYRMQLQWLGGMGVIVLAVAIMPMLGVGGMQLFRAETPGPVKDTKLTPRITETAKVFWYLYAGMTVACAAAYWLAGMSTFDAVTHSFATVATGGFANYDASFGQFNSAAILLIATFFMLVGAMNFALHFLAFRGRTLWSYFGDAELRTWMALLFLFVAVAAGGLYASGKFQNPGEATVQAMFHVVSVASTTGFSASDFAAWPGFLPVFILFIGFVGGCAGSTSGGIKMIRVLLLFKQGMREIMRLIHPAAQIPVKIGKKSMSEPVVSAVWGFFSLYVASFSVIMLAVMATGVDQDTAFSAVIACLNNVGLGIAGVGSNFGGLNDPAKWVLSFAMLLGRLEIFTLLVLLTPAFWRK
jgi:trk system potassium uptake protein TrkH